MSQRCFDVSPSPNSARLPHQRTRASTSMSLPTPSASSQPTTATTSTQRSTTTTITHSPKCSPRGSEKFASDSGRPSLPGCPADWPCPTRARSSQSHGKPSPYPIVRYIDDFSLARWAPVHLRRETKRPLRAHRGRPHPLPSRGHFRDGRHRSFHYRDRV